MVWIDRRVIILFVAGITLDLKGFEVQERSRWMAVLAIRGDMGAQQRETAELVQLGDIFNHPGIRSVTPGAIHAHRLLVHIRVAGGAIIFSSGKDQGGMAVFAANLGMLPGQCIFRQAVVE